MKGTQLDKTQLKAGYDSNRKKGYWVYKDRRLPRTRFETATIIDGVKINLRTGELLK